MRTWYLIGRKESKPVAPERVRPAQEETGRVESPTG
jgi:hypothetical protein